MAELVGSRAHDLFRQLQQIDPLPDQDFDITLSLELLANIDADFGRLKEAKEKQRQIYEIRKKLASFANAKPDWQMAFATMLESLATILVVGEGQFAEATSMLREALAIRTAGLNNSPDDEGAIRACLESRLTECLVNHACLITAIVAAIAYEYLGGAAVRETPLVFRCPPRRAL
jgi:hypothetical protein